MSRLMDQVVIVTGASRGIGRAITEALAAGGAAVALAARAGNELFEVADAITAQGGKALVIRADVSIEEQVVGLVHQTLEAFGRLDIVVNNAGVGVFGNLVESTTEQWNSVMEITLKGAYLVARESVKTMLPRGGGLLINVGSDLSYRTNEECGVYGIAKYGLGALTQAYGQRRAPAGAPFFFITM